MGRKIFGQVSNRGIAPIRQRAGVSARVYGVIFESIGMQSRMVSNLASLPLLHGAYKIQMAYTYTGVLKKIKVPGRR
jgi:hypothetical protein